MMAGGWRYYANSGYAALASPVIDATYTVDDFAQPEPEAPAGILGAEQSEPGAGDDENRAPAPKTLLPLREARIKTTRKLRSEKRCVIIC